MKTVPHGVGLGLRADFIDEVAAGRAEGRVAFFEVSPENYMDRGGRQPALLEPIAERHPLLTHGLMMSLGGVDPLDRDYLFRLREFCDRFDGPWHSDHLCFSRHREVLLHELLPVPMTREHATHIAGRVREAQRALGRPMIVENISYYLFLGRPELDEAEFAQAVTDEADCGLLLDVNNIYVNAQNFGFDPFEMLSRYPLERVRQMHVAGHNYWDPGELIIDNHGADVLPAVHRMMQYVVERVGPVPVLLERDQEIPPLDDLLREVELLQVSYDAALSRHRGTGRSASLELRHGG
jgi:uncharacterized protein (UPF0276 family)